MSSGYRRNWRDRLVYRTCNWLINRVATKEYRAFVSLRLMWGGDVMDRWIEKGASVDVGGQSK